MGQEMSEKYFEYLSKMQHCSYVKGIFEILEENLSPNHRFRTFLKLYSETLIGEETTNEVLEKNKIYGSLTKFPSYEECIGLLPKNGIYVILQLSNDRSSIYYGCLVN